jgi:hypothetical protein
MQFIEPYVIVTLSPESAQCRLDLHLFQAGKFHGTYAVTRYQGNAMERPFSISTLGSVYDVAKKIYDQAIRTKTNNYRQLPENTSSQSAS